jgi:hypothetical protein
MHTGPTTTIFREGGKLIHPHLRIPQNTTVSALITLQKLPVGQREFRIRVAQKEADENQPLPWQEFHELYQRDADMNDRTVLRTIVYENPYAATPLPTDVFTGRYDERWGPVPGQPYIARTYAGTALQQLEDAEHQFELDLSPLQKHIKKRQAPKAQGWHIVAQDENVYAYSWEGQPRWQWGTPPRVAWRIMCRRYHG